MPISYDRLMLEQDRKMARGSVRGRVGPRIWAVERIVEKKMLHRRPHYRAGWTEEDDTWEPRSHVAGLVAEFEEEQRKQREAQSKAQRKQAKQAKQAPPRRPFVLPACGATARRREPRSRRSASPTPGTTWTTSRAT